MSINEHRLKDFSINNKHEELASQAQDPSFVLSWFALHGQWTNIYAAANTGKTLITLSCLVRALAKKLNAELNLNYFYVNADDNFDGLLDKLDFAKSFGFDMLVPGYEGFSCEMLLGLLIEVCDRGQSKSTVVILDTLKKFTDPMDKSQARKFGKAIREFILQGGTLITLAHTNKRPGPDGRPIPEGTADIQNDSDCVYLLYETSIDAESSVKTVEMECIKSRGRAPQKLALEYSTDQELEYARLLTTVRLLSEDELESRQVCRARQLDQNIIDSIFEAMHSGVTNKMGIRNFVCGATGETFKRVLGVIEKYTGTDQKLHLWSCERGAHGKLCYEPLDSSESIHKLGDKA